MTGRRRLLAVNIAMFSLMMPIVALSPGFSVFIAARALSTFAMNGEWSLGSMLVAETWPPHLRGRVISINRATWCFGASFAGAIAQSLFDHHRYGVCWHLRYLRRPALRAPCAGTARKPARSR